ncbi:T9SS type A sorting domain-containing protein [Sanyastnella coralliicola]|uniref:T9SS type A sorting domain-containing protein n=1 Tax=Sanyastnella coralliicola TaxID=3069118 RepID=UPI0027BADC9B|nr:T9SS type A sorting domain-containing protein [Longitalea sp. SCSIO 12813]
MKRILLFATALFAFTAASAQCTADYDFGDLPFGVSPDPLLGESFEVAELGMAYEDVIHIMVPTSAADIDDTFPAEAPIDSVVLVNISFVLADVTYTLEEMGLEAVCNNNGDSPDPCTFYGGTQYCASLEGTPLIAGEFQLIITVQGWTTVFGVPISQNIDFDQYTFIVSDGTSVAENAALELSLGNNVPNPADDQTTVPFTLNKAESVRLTVINLLGEAVIDELIDGRRGNNNTVLDVSELNNGIYLYSIEAAGKKMTKRMVINR